MNPTYLLIALLFFWAFSGTTIRLVDARSFNLRNVSAKTQDGALHETSSPRSESDAAIEQINFLTREIGWAVRGGNVIRTSDGGRTWQTQLAASNVNSEIRSLPIRNEFSRVVALNSSRILAIGGDTIFRSDNGGTTWDATAINGVLIRDVHFIDQERGWLIGEKRLPQDSEWVSSLYFSDDAGSTWSEVSVVRRASKQNTGTWWDVGIKPEKEIWIVGSFVLQSINAGKTWKERKVCDGIFGVPVEIGFADDLHGWLRTNQGNSFCITSDGGESWQAKSFPEMTGGILGIIQTSANSLWVYGLGGVFETINRGDSWKKVIDGKFTSAQYLKDSDQLIFGGDHIIVLEN